MQPLWFIVGAVALGGLVFGGLCWRPMRVFGREIQVERARELFALQRERLEGLFLQAAALTGKPRGLRWQGCTFDGTLELARDRKNGQLIGLIPATIAFEAIEGSDMEGLAAVGNLRNASAVFFFERGQWQTVGKAVFNLNPNEALEQFQSQYEWIKKA